MVTLNSLHATRTVILHTPYFDATAPMSFGRRLAGIDAISLAICSRRAVKSRCIPTMIPGARGFRSVVPHNSILIGADRPSTMGKPQ